MTYKGFDFSKHKVQTAQTGMMGAQSFNHDKHSIVDIPSTELRNSPKMKGYKANGFYNLCKSGVKEFSEI